MKRNYYLFSLVATVVAGVSTALYGPSNWIGPVYFIGVALLVLLGWLIVVDERAASRNIWHILLTGPIKSSVNIRPSGRVQGLVLVLAYLAGVSIGIIWVVNSWQVN